MQGDAAAQPSQRSSSGVPPPPGTNATTTVGSSGQRGTSNRGDHKVQFYDYSSRFEKEAEGRYAVHRHNSFEEERGSAMASARLEAEQRDGDGRRNEELQCRQQERSQAALARERLRCDYQRLLRQLPAFARASGTRLPAAVHLDDDRRQQRDALRQSNMATVFERLHHSLLEVDEAAAPSLHAASVTVSPQQTGDETPPKLNVGVCTQALESGLGEATLAAALESLQARLEQQRALLHSELGVLPNQHGSTTHTRSRKVCRKGKVHVHKSTISKDTLQAGKQTPSAKEIDHGDKEESNLESRKQESTQEENQYCKQESSSKDRNQEYEQEAISKDRSQEDKQEVRSKDTNQENKQELRSKDRHQGSKREVRATDWHQEGKREFTFKERNRDKRDSKSREKKQENKQKDKPEDRYPKIKRDHRSKERGCEGKQQGRSKEHNQENRQKHRSKEQVQESDSRSRDSSHDGSEIIMSEYSLDVSRSKRAEVTHSSMNSTEQSSSSSVHVYEDMKLMFNLKEVIRSPGRVGDRSQRRKHVCKKSLGMKKCRKVKLRTVEEGTQTSTDPGNGGKPPVSDDLQRNGQVMESSGSTAYLSPPQYLPGEQAEVVDQLLHAVRHQKEEVEELLSGRGQVGGGRETNPTLMLYIARLLSMSRASVEDLSIVSSPMPQETPCECLSPDSGQGKPEKTAPLRRQPQPANASPVTGPQNYTTSQVVCLPASVVCVPSTVSSEEVSLPKVLVQPPYKPPQTNVTAAIREPKMCTLPTDWFADSCVCVPEINVASLPGHESFENCNSEGNGKSTTQNNCDYSTSLLDVSLDVGSANQLSGNMSESENSAPSYPEFWNEYNTISRQYTERISEISAQIQSLREARKQLEGDQNAVLSSPVHTSTPLPPPDTTTSSVETAPDFLTWRSALASEASLQQHGRQPRQKPPSALDRSKLMARPELCGPAHELSTIVEVDTPQSSRVFTSTTVDQQQDVDSDDTLPDVAAELLKRGLITSTAQWQAEAASSFVTEEQQLAPGSGVQDLEAALARLGMSWASSTLRKVRLAEQLSTTSSETTSAAQHRSPPQEVRGHSTPLAPTPTPSVCMPSESDMSTVRPSPESLEIQTPGLGLRHPSF